MNPVFFWGEYGEVYDLKIARGRAPRTVATKHFK